MNLNENLLEKHGRDCGRVKLHKNEIENGFRAMMIGFAL